MFLQRIFQKTSGSSCSSFARTGSRRRMRRMLSKTTAIAALRTHAQLLRHHPDLATPLLLEQAMLSIPSHSCWKISSGSRSRRDCITETSSNCSASAALLSSRAKRCGLGSESKSKDSAKPTPKVSCLYVQQRKIIRLSTATRVRELVTIL